MGQTHALLVYIGVCLFSTRITMSDCRNTRQHYPIGIHCKGKGYPEDAQTTRSCCRKAHVPCREYISEHRKKPNCIVYDRHEEADVKDCCLRKMDWAKGRNYGDRC